MDEGRKGNPARRATRLVVGLRLRRDPVVLWLVVISVAITSLAGLLVPAGGLPSPTVNVGVATGPANARAPALAVDASGALRLVHTDDTSGENGIYTSDSADGTAWSPSVRIDTPGASSYFPHLAIEREPVAVRGRTYVAYQVGTTSAADVWLTSADGAIWSAPRRIDLGPANTGATTPVIAASGGHVYLAWADSRNGSVYQIFFRASLDGSASWGLELQLATMREYVRVRGWESIEYVETAAAGDLAHRTAWSLLQSDVGRRRVDRVLVWKLDRAFRRWSAPRAGRSAARWSAASPRRSATQAR